MELTAKVSVKSSEGVDQRRDCRSDRDGLAGRESILGPVIPELAIRVLMKGVEAEIWETAEEREDLEVTSAWMGIMLLLV